MFDGLGEDYHVEKVGGAGLQKVPQKILHFSRKSNATAHHLITTQF